jgi:hypothetical protein
MEILPLLYNEGWRAQLAQSMELPPEQWWKVAAMVDGVVHLTDTDEHFIAVIKSLLKDIALYGAQYILLFKILKRYVNHDGLVMFLLSKG